MSEAAQQPPAPRDAAPPAVGPALPILGYDDYDPRKDTGARWVILWFWLGEFLAAVIYVAICFVLMHVKPDVELAFSPLVDSFFLPLITTLCTLLPATLFLGLSLWARYRLVKEVRHADLRTTVATGLIFGLFPFPILRFFPVLSIMPVFWAGVAWCVLFPIAASFWLCYRWHLRD